MEPGGATPIVDLAHTTTNGASVGTIAAPPAASVGRTVPNGWSALMQVLSATSPASSRDAAGTVAADPIYVAASASAPESSGLARSRSYDEVDLDRRIEDHAGSLARFLRTSSTSAASRIMSVLPVGQSPNVSSDQLRVQMPPTAASTQSSLRASRSAVDLQDHSSNRIPSSAGSVVVHSDIRVDDGDADIHRENDDAGHLERQPLLASAFSAPEPSNVVSSPPFGAGPSVPGPSGNVAVVNSAEDLTDLTEWLEHNFVFLLLLLMVLLYHYFWGLLLCVSFHLLWKMSSKFFVSELASIYKTYSVCSSSSLSSGDASGSNTAGSSSVLPGQLVVGAVESSHGLLGRISRWLHELSRHRSSAEDVEIDKNPFSRHGTGFFIVAAVGVSVTLVCFLFVVHPSVLYPIIFTFPPLFWYSSFAAVMFTVLLNDAVLRYASVVLRSLCVSALLVRHHPAITAVNFLRNDFSAHTSPLDASARGLLGSHQRRVGYVIGAVEQFMVLYRMLVTTIPWLAYFLYAPQGHIFASFLAAFYSVLKLRRILDQLVTLSGQLIVTVQNWRRHNKSYDSVIRDLRQKGGVFPNLQPRSTDLEYGGTSSFVSAAVGNADVSGAASMERRSSRASASSTSATFSSTMIIRGGRFTTDADRYGSDHEPHQCSICQEDLHVRSIVLECGHVFDEDCLQSWLRRTTAPSCPNCRAAVATISFPYSDGTSYPYAVIF